MVIEGVKLAAEAVAAGVDVTDCAVTPDVLDGPHAALVARLEGKGATVRVLAPPLLSALSETETSQGLLAVARRPVFDEQRLFRGTPLIAVGVGIQNPGNVGALLRTAEAAGRHGRLPRRGLRRSALVEGAARVDGQRVPAPPPGGGATRDVLDRLGGRGVRDAGRRRRRRASDYDDVDLAGPVAVLVGNEGAGLPADVAGRASVRVRIPMTRAGGEPQRGRGRRRAALRGRPAAAP